MSLFSFWSQQSFFYLPYCSFSYLIVVVTCTYVFPLIHTCRSGFSNWVEIYETLVFLTAMGPILLTVDLQSPFSLFCPSGSFQLLLLFPSPEIVRSPSIIYWNPRAQVWTSFPLCVGLIFPQALGPGFMPWFVFGATSAQVLSFLVYSGCPMVVPYFSPSHSVIYLSHSSLAFSGWVISSFTFLFCGEMVLDL